MERDVGDSHSRMMGESLIISGRVPGTREEMGDMGSPPGTIELTGESGEARSDLCFPDLFLHYLCEFLYYIDFFRQLEYLFRSDSLVPVGQQVAICDQPAHLFCTIFIDEIVLPEHDEYLTVTLWDPQIMCNRHFAPKIEYTVQE